MIAQTQIWLLTLTGIGLVSLVFIWVTSQASKPDDSAQVQKASYAIRRWWFLALVLLGVGVAYATLKPFPIADQSVSSSAAQIVDVVGQQWSWKLSQKQVKAGIPVQFNVTSTDVNHGFAIYGPDDLIVTQTQAMPGFTNRLHHTFMKLGKYRVMCLEYCGVAHHGMVSEFEVVNGG